MKKYFLSFFILTCFSLLFFSLPIHAQSQKTQSTAPCPAGSATCLTNPLGSVSTPQALIGRVINSVLGIVGSLALLMFVYGGLIWMTSSGNQEKVKKGRDTLVWAAIGLVIIFSAYALTRVLITSVTG